MRFSLAVDNTTPSAIGIAPPERPVPAPRGTILMPRRWQVLSTAITSASVSGNTTARGNWR